MKLGEYSFHQCRAEVRSAYPGWNGEVWVTTIVPHGTAAASAMIASRLVATHPSWFA